MNLPIIYHPSYYCPEASELTSTRKQKEVYEQAIQEGIISDKDLILAPMATPEEIILAHDPKYVNAVLTGKPLRLAESQGFKWSPKFAELVLRTAGGQKAACEVSLQHGIAFNLASGAHHASYEKGDGFCTFNYLVSAPRTLMQEGKINKVLILDFDEHQGNGTWEITRKDPRFFTYDISGSYFGVNPHASKDGIYILLSEYNDPLGAYQAALSRIPEIIEWFQPDIIEYQAGMDCWEQDPLAGVAGITSDFLAERDEYVIHCAKKYNIPIVVNLAGGYVARSILPSEEITLDTVSLHVETLRIAKKIINENNLLSNPTGRIIPSKYEGLCRKDCGGCGSLIAAQQEIILVKEDPPTWLHRKCGENLLGLKPQNIPLSNKKFTFWEDPLLTKPFIYDSESKGSLHLGTDKEEDVEKIKQRYYTIYSKPLFVKITTPKTEDKFDCEGLGLVPDFKPSNKQFTFWLDSTYRTPYVFKNAEGIPIHLSSNDRTKALDFQQRFYKKCGKTIYIKEITVAKPGLSAPAPIFKPILGKLPSFPSKGSGDYVVVSLKDWEVIRDSYIKAGIDARIFIPNRWKQYALLIDNMVRVSTTLDIRGEDARGKGVNAIDIVEVKDAEGPPIGGRTKVLRTDGWMGRVVERINDLLIKKYI